MSAQYQHRASRFGWSQRCRPVCRKLSLSRSAAEPAERSHSVSVSFPNFRDIGQSAPEVVQLGKVYRTACPVSATDDQMQQLYQMGVTTMIDLRAPEEIKQFGEPDILKQAGVWAYPRDNTGLFTPPSVSAVPQSADHPATTKTTTSRTSASGSRSPPHPPTEPTFEVHRLSLLDRKRYVKRLMLQVPPVDAIMSLVYQIWDMDASEAVLMRNINSGGVTMLYEIMLRTSTVEIGAAVQVILAALERAEGVMMYCKAGKDRTGILTALLLALAGASDDQIIQDYALSDVYGDMALGSVTRDTEMRKLDRTVFSRAPPEAMAATLAFLRREYGSVEQYLAACGVPAASQDRLRRLLRTAPGSP